jgi:N-methylhydantoinase A
MAMIAFGGGAPLHACRLAEKTGIRRIIVPQGAGVGSAIGFLQAPISYEVTHSAALSLDDFDAAKANALLKQMEKEAAAVVAPVLGKRKPAFSIVADCRYVGQGHEIRIAIPVRTLTIKDSKTLKSAFEKAYKAVYGLTIPGQQAEAITWSLTASGPLPALARPPRLAKAKPAKPSRSMKLFDAKLGKQVQAPVYWRFALPPSQRIKGPAIIAEHETSTVVGAGFTVKRDNLGNLVLERSK